MKKQKLFFIFLIIFLLINLVFAVKYYNSKNIFEITETEVFQENGKYFVNIKIDSYVGKLNLYSELIYKAENLVVDEDNFVCNDYCEIALPIEDVFFGSYGINLYTKYKSKYYIEKKSFYLEESQVFKPEVNISLNEDVFLIEDESIKIGGNIINENSFDPVMYLLEIYPLSKSDYRQYYEKVCFGSCSFELDLEGPYVVDKYQVNLYSSVGETFTFFEIKVNQTNNNQSNNTQEKYYLEKLPEKFIYSNNANVVYNLSFDVSKENKNLNEITNLDNVNVEININQGNVQRILIPDTKIEETSIGFEYVEKEKVNLSFDVENAFAINPQVSSNVQNYNLDFIAQATAVYKCSKYDFNNQNCFGNYVKILDTIPGQNYSLTLTPVDPIFVEVWEPKLEVQRGVKISAGTTITQSINSINQSQSIILFDLINAQSTPDDIQMTPDFQDDSTIRFSRYDGATIDTEISWQVISSNLFNVQRGSRALEFSEASFNVPINNVNLSSSFVIVYGRCADATTSDNHAGYFIGNLTSQNNLHIERGQAYKCRATVNWQVVDFEGSQVQSGKVDFSSTDTSLSNTISPINRLKSFLVFSSMSIDTDPGMNSNLFRGEISQSNEVTFTRTGAETNSARSVLYYIVEHPFLNVQRGLTSFSNDVTQSISTIANLSQTFSLTSVANSGGGQTYRNYLYHTTFNDESTLSFTKQTTQQTNDVNWQVIEFITQPVDLSGQVNITSSSGNDYSQDDLICQFNLGGDVDNVIVNWLVNSNNIVEVYLPMEGSETNAVKDFSGNNYEVVNNGATFSVNGGAGNTGAFSFDGGTDYLDFADFNFDFSQGFSISFWAQWNSFNAWSRIMDFGNGGSSDNILIANQGTTNNFVYEVYNGGTTNGQIIANGILSTGVLSHYVITHANNGDVKIYQNGIEVQTGNINLPNNLNRIENFIGRSNWVADQYFNGIIDDFKIYKRVLSRDEIVKLSNYNLVELANEETHVGETWECKVNGFNSENVGPEYVSDNSVFIKANPLPITNSSPNTCSGVFGFSCLTWPSTSEGDNTFDTCPTGSGGDEHVREVYINASSVYTNSSIDITCEFDPYSNGNEEYIYYYDGSSWIQVYSGSAPDGNIHNVTQSFTVGNFVGDHWFRCIIDWDGENDECANQGSYYDNDDVKVEVLQRPIPFDLSIIEPQEINYSTSYLLANFTTTKFADISYSIDSSPYIGACSYCKDFSFSQIYRNGVHNLTVKAIEDGTEIEIIKSVIFNVNFSNVLPPLDSNATTCSNTFGFNCGNWPSTSEADNTFDTCSNSAGSDENVQEVYLNSSAVYYDSSVEVTCQFDPYSNQNEEYIYYYDGSSWTQIYSGNSPSGDVHNVTQIVNINNQEGTHWFRCIIDWDGENDECASVGSYYDNDDVNLSVIDNSLPPIPFVLSILSPLNITYSSSNVLFDFMTSKNANISYSINGENYISACSNCTSFTSNITASSRSNFLSVKAIDLTNVSNIIYENITFSLDNSVDLEPGINNLNLRSSSGTDQTSEDLICDYSLNTLANSSVINWYLDGSSLNIVNLPFDGNTSNALLDFSGENNYATIGGNTLWNSLGYFYFDGDNDYLNLGDIDELDSPNEFSISLWFNRQVDVGDTTNHGVGNILIGQSSQTNNDNLEIGTVGTSIELYVDTSGTDSMSYDAGIQNNRWYHLGITYDSTRTNELELYLDGILIQSFNQPNGALASSATSQLSLGIARPDVSDPGGDFNGFIDNVQIFNYAISSEFMTNLANNDSKTLPSIETVEGNNWQCKVTAFNENEKSEEFVSNNLEVLENSFRGLHLALNKTINRLSDNLYNVRLSLFNLRTVPTPKNQILKIYGFISNNSIISNRQISSSSWYNSQEFNESISGGQIYEWRIIENNLDDSALNRNTGTINETNSFLIEFNVSGIGNYTYMDLMRFGFDPVKE